MYLGEDPSPLEAVASLSAMGGILRVAEATVICWWWPIASMEAIELTKLAKATEV